jgi:hypothetical protein
VIAADHRHRLRECQRRPGRRAPLYVGEGDTPIIELPTASAIATIRFPRSGECKRDEPSLEKTMSGRARSV